MSEHDALPPEPQVVKVGDKILEITPIRVGDIPALLAAVRPFHNVLVSDPVDWLSVITEHGEAFITSMAVAARQSREWIDALSLDEAILLATAVFEVNIDFFLQKVEPAIRKATGQINTLVKARLAGVTQSPA